jgi:hypothetical protein
MNQPYRSQRVEYQDLNSRQQENYNFQKVASHLADFGFNCIRLSDDWQGADFIACHYDGQTFLKVQLKGRLEIGRRYSGKDIYIAFIYTNDDGSKDVYVYPHDVMVSQLIAWGTAKDRLVNSVSWRDRGGYSWGYLSKDLKQLLQPFKV